jgi:hypothetical protein
MLRQEQQVVRRGEGGELGRCRPSWTRGRSMSWLEQREGKEVMPWSLYWAEQWCLRDQRMCRRMYCA